MPQVEISDALFGRLQKLAVPLVDNLETVIEKLADAYEHGLDGRAGQGKISDSEIRTFNATSVPSLTHTKVLSIRLGDEVIQNPTWNGLLEQAIRRAQRRLTTTQEMKRLIIVPFVQGEKRDEGYRFIEDVGISVQGQDANGAWKGACHIARQLGTRLQVEFLWRDKEGAAFPGVTGRLSS